MSESRETAAHEDLNEQTRQIWNANAEWWDDRIGDGNDFQVKLIEPATERLIEIAPGAAVLDIACGAGRFARRMAELGAQVTAIDFCERFIERARARTPADLTNVEYHLVDVTKTDELLALGAGRFDGAVATMAMMDISDIEPLMDALAVLLRPDGWFVFSVMHPCFESPGSTRFAESTDVDGDFEVRNGVKISQYLTPRARKGAGIVGQPEPHYYFHRPLSVLLGAGFGREFVVDALAEPTYAEPPANKEFLRWSHMPEIPPVLAVRMRLQSGQ